jgi:D-serine deaminase-like pyridoxal phosphate-dependent protein
MNGGETVGAELETPALILDRAVLDRNLAAMAARASAAGASLWPHAKTHKTAEIARLQLEHGAAGITAATVHEAEVFATAGAGDVLLAYPPVGDWRLDRIVALARRVRLRVVLDDPGVVSALSRAARGAGVEVGWLWEVDCGVGRCGTEPGRRAAEAVSAVIAAEPNNVPFAGVMAFAGHAYQAADDAELDRIAAAERAAVVDTATALAERGIEAPALSIGTTPTISRLPASPVVAFEIRPGNYVFNDASQVALGTASLEECALSVLTTVVSRPAPDRLILDCGSKAMTSERPSPRSPGLGIVLGHPEVTVERAFEEHAIASCDPSSPLAIGDRVRVVPDHACPAVNLHSCIHVSRGTTIVEEWSVRARGW